MHRAMDMFSDLRQFAEAKTWADEWERTKDLQPLSLPSGGGSPGQAGPVAQSLVQRQAEWNEEMKDYQAAADMYLQVVIPSAASITNSMPYHRIGSHCLHPTCTFNSRHLNRLSTHSLHHHTLRLPAVDDSLLCHIA